MVRPNRDHAPTLVSSLLATLAWPMSDHFIGLTMVTSRPLPRNFVAELRRNFDQKSIHFWVDSGTFGVGLVALEALTGQKDTSWVNSALCAKFTVKIWPKFGPDFDSNLRQFGANLNQKAHKIGSVFWSADQRSARSRPYQNGL